MNGSMYAPPPNWQVPEDLWWAMELELQEMPRRGSSEPSKDRVLSRMTATHWAWVVDVITPPNEKTNHELTSKTSPSSGGQASPRSRKRKPTLPPSAAAAQKALLHKRDIEIARTWIERIEWNNPRQNGLFPYLSPQTWQDVLEQIIAQQRAQITQSTPSTWNEALAEWIRAGRLLWGTTAQRARGTDRHAGGEESAVQRNAPQELQDGEPAGQQSGQQSGRQESQQKREDVNDAFIARLITSVLENPTEPDWMQRRLLSACLAGLPPALLGLPARWGTVIQEHYGPLVDVGEADDDGSAPQRAKPATTIAPEEPLDPPRALFAARMQELLTSWGHDSGAAERTSRQEPLSASGDSSTGESLAVNADVAHAIDVIWGAVDQRRRTDNDLGLFGRSLKERRDWPATAVADLVSLTGNHGVLGDFDDIDAMPPAALYGLAADSGPYWSAATARVVLQLGHDPHGELLPEAQAATVAWLEQRNDEHLRGLDEYIGTKSLAALVASEALVERLPSRLLTRLVASLPSAARISLLGTLARVRVGTVPPNEKGKSLVRSGRS